MGLYGQRCGEGHSYTWWSGQVNVCPTCVTEPNDVADLNVLYGYPDPLGRSATDPRVVELNETRAGWMRETAGVFNEKD